MRADRSPAQVLVGLRIDDGVAAGLGGKGGTPGKPQGDHGGERENKQQQLSHKASFSGFYFRLNSLSHNRRMKFITPLRRDDTLLVRPPGRAARGAASSHARRTD